MERRYHTLKQLLTHPEFTEGQYWCRARYAGGELVIREGQRNHEVYVVLSGSLMVCTDVEVSDTVHLSSGLCELFDGEEFALSCFFDDQPHSATVKTLSECELAVVDAGKLKVFLNQHPDLGYQILFHWLQCLLPRLRMDNRRIATLLGWGLKAHRIDGELKPG
jgi:CRP-like cAMP-binding protein